MPTLRSRKPYTCRMSIAGKVCAAYLVDDDGEICKTHAEANKRFMSTPAKTDGQVFDEMVLRRIWP